MLAIVYLNDMKERVAIYMSLFANDKIMRKITNKHYEALNLNLIRINEWVLRWNMQINVKKCSVVESGNSKKNNGKLLLGK